MFNRAYFPDHVLVGMMIDIGPRFNSAVPPALANDHQVKVMELKLLYKSSEKLIFSRPYDGFCLYFGMIIDIGAKFYSTLPFCPRHFRHLFKRALLSDDSSCCQCNGPTEDPDQSPHSAASDLGLHCLPK